MIQVKRYKYEVFTRLDGRDTINLKDFLSCIADISNKVDGPEIIKQCFAVFDKDETGLINIDEFRHVMSTLGDTMSNEEVYLI
jgi:calmodulin